MIALVAMVLAVGTQYPIVEVWFTKDKLSGHAGLWVSHGMRWIESDARSRFGVDPQYFERVPRVAGPYSLIEQFRVPLGWMRGEVRRYHIGRYVSLHRPSPASKLSLITDTN